MQLSLQKHYQLESIKGGLALFDTFNGHTHFLTEPISLVIMLLNKKSYSTELLLDKLIHYHDSSSEHPLSNDDIKLQYQHFIEDALKSGIIHETN
jgi:hypothetical protein